MMSMAQEIELIREFHTRLISDVVTGKLDVRETAATLPDLKCQEFEDDHDAQLGGGSIPKLDEAHAGLAESVA